MTTESSSVRGNLSEGACLILGGSLHCLPVLDIYLELKKVVSALEQQGIAYAICGGLAVSIHAEPRATEDLDVMVLAQDLGRCEVALEPLGFRRYGEAMKFAQGRVTVQRLLKFEVGSEDQVVLDLLVVGPPVLDTVWQSRQSFEWEGMKVWVVSREGLIALKRLRGSPQDLVDIERLESQGP